MNILFIGDVVGRPGREALENHLPELEHEFSIDFTIVNGENSSGGWGMDYRAYETIVSAGADAITLGNHSFDNHKIFDFIDKKTNIIRPANISAKCPGRGWNIFTLKNGERIAVVNLCGRSYSNMQLNCPFDLMESILRENKLRDCAVFVDFHGDATGEKVCFGHYFAGRVSAICGTHTHIQTADEKILAGSTAYITDAGMTGAADSCLGMSKKAAIARFMDVRKLPMKPASGERQINGCVIELDKEYKAKNIFRINRLYPEY